MDEGGGEWRQRSKQIRRELLVGQRRTIIGNDNDGAGAVNAVNLPGQIPRRGPCKSYRLGPGAPLK